MAYSKFTYDKVRNDLGIQDVPLRLFETIIAVEPSEHLRFTLAQAEDVAFFSEKSRSEAIVFPILVELRAINHKEIAIYSGADLSADENKELSGECDYILSKGQQKLEVDTPFICMIEAKDQDMKKAIPQCIAQMEGARIYNQNHQKEIAMLWGCVTTGMEWLFLKLENKTAYIDTKRYSIVKVEEILGILQAIVNSDYSIRVNNEFTTKS